MRPGICSRKINLRPQPTSRQRSSPTTRFWTIVSPHGRRVSVQTRDRALRLRDVFTVSGHGRRTSGDNRMNWPSEVLAPRTCTVPCGVNAGTEFQSLCFECSPRYPDHDHRRRSLRRTNVGGSPTSAQSTPPLTLRECRRIGLVTGSDHRQAHRLSVRKRSTRRSAVVRSARSWTLWRFRAPDVR